MHLSMVIGYKLNGDLMKRKIDGLARALNIFDRWVRTEGGIARGSSQYHDLCSIVEDAVEIGKQEESGLYQQLGSEIKPFEYK